MKKGKIILYLFISIIILSGAVVYFGYSYTDSAVVVGESVVDDNIIVDGLSFSGNVALETDIWIYNSGLLDLENVEVTIQVFFESDSGQFLVGEGTNDLGVLPSKENSSRLISITLTWEIPRLAIEDGILHIQIDTNLNIRYIPYLIEFNETSDEIWNAPFKVPEIIFPSA